jgi:hypothetical protein
MAIQNLQIYHFIFEFSNFKFRQNISISLFGET